MARPEFLEIIWRKLNIGIAAMSESVSIKASPHTEIRTG